MEGGLDLNSSQYDFNNIESQLNEKITALRKNEETLLAKIKQLEEQNARLQSQNQELNHHERSVHISSNQTLDLSRISNRSETSGSLSLGDSKECRYLSDFLTELQKTDSERIHLRPGDDFDSQERTFETKISFSRKAIKNFISEYKELEQEKNELRAYKNKHQSENDTTYKFSELKPDSAEIKTFYDCRIIADSLFSLLWPEKQERWQIEFKNWKKYRKQCEQESLVVSVVGNENRGKSFVISQVLGHEIPQGKNQRTVGIGALYPHKHSQNIHCIALDTPGTNVAVRTELKMEELKEYFDDKNLSEAEIVRRLYGDVRIMESLLHEFVMQHAEVLLVVVDQLGREDQQFLNSIKAINKNTKRRILVIHNWSSCNKIENIEELIQYNIQKTHKTQEREIGKKDGRKICAYEENTAEGEITHVIMAHQGSPAGNLYNDLSLEFIRNVIRSTNIMKKFDLITAFKQHLETYIENYLYKTMEDLREGEEEKFSLQKNADSAPSSLFLNNARTYDLKNNTVNEIGILKTFVQGRLETVPYVIKFVQITHEEITHQVIQIEFEVCGDYREREVIVQKTTGRAVIVTITGISEDNGAQGGVVNVVENTRSFGRFKIVTGEIDLGDLILNVSIRPQITDGNSGLKIATIFLIAKEEGDWK